MLHLSSKKIAINFNARKNIMLNYHYLNAKVILNIRVVTKKKASCVRIIKRAALNLLRSTMKKV